MIADYSNRVKEMEKALDFDQLGAPCPGNGGRRLAGETLLAYGAGGPDPSGPAQAAGALPGGAVEGSYAVGV